VNGHTPEITASSLFFEMAWSELDVRMTLSHFYEQRNHRISAELLVTTLEGGYMMWDSFTITSKRGRSAVVKSLLPIDQLPPWGVMVEQLCRQAVLHRRKGEPVEEVGNQPLGTKPRWQLWPIIPMNEPCIIFGDGDSMKSLTALAFGVCVQYGLVKWGVRPVSGNVLWLDWETSADEVNRRLMGLQEEFDLPKPPVLHYQFCYRSLVGNVEQLAKIVSDLDISLIIVDNIGAAIKGKATDDDAARDFMNAVRELKVSALLIAHDTKYKEKGRKPMPFGSVFWENRARNVFMVKKENYAGSDESLVVYHHTKTNVGSRRKPMGFRVVWNDLTDTIAIHRSDADIYDSDVLVRDLSLRQRIEQFLLANAKGPMVVADIADGLGLAPEDRASLRTTLNRYKGKQFVKIGDGWGVMSRS